MSSRVLLSAIVVNYRRRELLATCLDSLAEALARVVGETELIVVDNGSGDGSVELVRERHPKARVVGLVENRGFAGGVKEGLAASSGEWVLLLNNDATIEPDGARLLLDAGSRSPDIGSVACQMRFTGTDVVNSAGIGVDRLGVAFDRLLGEPASAAGVQPVEVFGASGGAALYRRAMLDDIGGFDDSFFAYLEDADVAWRARMRGWRSLYHPGAVVHHQYSATSGHRSSFKYLHSGRNRIRLLAKNAVRRQLLRHGLHMLVYDIAYIAGVGVRDRTLAPLTGRLRGLREWRRYRVAGVGRRPVTLAPARGVIGGLRRRASWARHVTVRRSPGTDSNPAVPPRLTGGADWSAAGQATAPEQRAVAMNGAPTSSSDGIPAGLRTLAVLHLAEVTGPSRTLRPRLERMASHGSLEVVVPGPGTAADSYRDIARVTTIDYRPLYFPAAADVPAITHRMARDVQSFRRHLREQRPDLVVIATATLPAALMAAKLEGLPVIVKLAEIFDKGHVRSAPRLLAGQATLALHRSMADSLICSSIAVASQLRMPGRARVMPLYPGISPEHARGNGAEFRAAHGLSDASPLIAVVGNIATGRGQDLVVRALGLLVDRLPSAACVLVGAPHPNALDREFCRKVVGLADDLGLSDRVVLTGFVDRVADVYAAADVVVNPARFNEPFGRVAPEALVAGRPVVATRVGAIPEVLRDGVDALLVEPEDPAAIAAAVGRLVEDPELAGRLVEEGRRRVLRDFSEERGADEFERVAAELVAARRSYRASPVTERSRQVG